MDDDSFDYTFYTYGLSMYGNMPLIEPQETKEVKKIEEFVIVVDTSMSCSGELVRKFLEETYDVLSENEVSSGKFTSASCNVTRSPGGRPYYEAEGLERIYGASEILRRRRNRLPSVLCLY